MGATLDKRRALASARIHELRKELATASEICEKRACVYLTGSFGRNEAGQQSDLDIFIVGLGDSENRALSRIDEILLKAELVESAKKLHFPEFSGDGEYLTHHTLRDLIKNLGTARDDFDNTFTARMLLLLEGEPLLCQEVYSQVLNEVISKYWRDYATNSAGYVPAFLTNDIIRMWRTFCVNYEARTSDEPDAKKAKRRLKNYKLKHSRLLTCYSALLYLLQVFSTTGTVSPKDALVMVGLTPTERIEKLQAESVSNSAKDALGRIIELYEVFLNTTHQKEEELLDSFLDNEKRKSYRASAIKLGDNIFNALNEIGQGNAFHRLIVV